MAIAFVPSDGGAPGGLLDLSAGTILFEQAIGLPFKTTTAGDRFPDGLFVLGNNGGGTGPLSIWRWNGQNLFTKIGLVLAPASQNVTWPDLKASQDGSGMWLADVGASSTNTPTFRKFNEAGTILKSSGTIPNHGGFQSMAPSNDELTMYHCASTANSALHAWDLTNNVAFADVVANLGDATLNYVTLYPIPSSTDIIAVLQKSFDGVNPVTNIVRRYTKTGTIVYSNDVYDIPAAFTDTTIEFARDPSMNQFWLRLPAAPAYNAFVASVYLQISMATGLVVNAPSPIVTVNADGAPTRTCPFFILAPGAVPSGSGTPCGSFT